MTAANILFSNFSEAKLATPPTGTGGLTFSVAAGKGALFPAAANPNYFYGIFTNSGRSVFEVVKVITRATDAMTIDPAGRALDGTTAQTWTANDTFYYGMTASMLSEFFGHVTQAVAAHAATAISNTPAGNIAATTVQAALNELDTKKVSKAGDTMAGSLNLAVETTLASAGTVAIFAANTNSVAISGTTAVTAFDTIAAGARRNIRATGAFQVTNSGALACPAGVSIQTQVGDTFEAVSLGSGNSRIENYVAVGGAFTTGDAKLTLKASADTGWVMMNDGTIGDSSSAATTRANDDTSALFQLLWNNISDANAPVVGGRGGSAAADFTAHKKITLPKTLGRALALAGAGASLTARALGDTTGEETHLLTTPEIPSHTHSIGNASGTAIAQGGGLVGYTTSLSGVSGTAGGGGTHNNMQPTTFLNVMVKL